MKPEPDFRALTLALSDPDRERAKRALVELARYEERAESYALEQFPAAVPPLRARLCALLGRVRGTRRPECMALLVTALGDADARTRRAAAIALGKLQAREHEPALLAALNRESDASARRGLVEALGKVGGPASLAALCELAEPPAPDAETARVLAEARLKLQRERERGHESEIVGTRAPPEPLALVLHCRAGLEDMLLRELEPEFRGRTIGPGAVQAELSVPLERVFHARVMTRFGFMICRTRLAEPAQLEQAVVDALTSPLALSVFETFTRGPIRYRLEWEDAGHRRGMTFRIARAVSASQPQLVNDPTSSTWEVYVSDRDGGELRVEIVPRGLRDPRFEYRVRDVPAASHPTLAAALARAGGAQPGDVVWDPFTGSGLELIERARLGPYSRLLGSDIEPRALDAARANAAAAGLENIELIQADARELDPGMPLSLIITNPPFGRRTGDARAMEALYATLLARAARLLTPDGRLVWISPLFERTLELAREQGFEPVLRRRVDMGGFHAELQLLRRIKRARPAPARHSPGKPRGGQSPGGKRPIRAASRGPR